MKKTLTIILGLTREANFTYPSLLSNVLIPLESDLAFCGSANSSEFNPILENSKYVWNEPDPIDWSKACDSISLDYGTWREFGKVPSNLLTGSFPNQTAGPGMIFAYRWEILRRHITDEILDEYEWFVITRSDFFWEIEHPNIALLQKNKIYQMDGRRWGGLSDRHIIFHKDNAKKIFAFAQPIFGTDVDIKDRFVKTTRKRLPNYPHINFEQYLYFIAKEFDLQSKITYIPYLGYLIRHEGVATNWSSGVFDAERNCYIKYPDELTAVSSNKILLNSQGDWIHFFSKSTIRRFLLLFDKSLNIKLFRFKIIRTKSSYFEIIAILLRLKLDKVKFFSRMLLKLCKKFMQTHGIVQK